MYFHSFISVRVYLLVVICNCNGRGLKYLASRNHGTEFTDVSVHLVPSPLLDLAVVLTNFNFFPKYPNLWFWRRRWRLSAPPPSSRPWWESCSYLSMKRRCFFLIMMIKKESSLKSSPADTYTSFGHLPASGEPVKRENIMSDSKLPWHHKMELSFWSFCGSLTKCRYRAAKAAKQNVKKKIIPILNSPALHLLGLHVLPQGLFAS